MSRLACLLVPDLPVAAVVRADPDLAGLPLVLIDGAEHPHAPLVASAAAARARGVWAGRHTVAQGRAIAADLVVRRRDPAAEDSARHALAGVAASLASRLEIGADGAIFLDASGVTHLVGSEAGLATALVTRAARVGFAGARAAVGASMIVARLAALAAAEGVEVVPAGAECGFLAPLPLGRLATATGGPLDPRLAATLARWGVHTLGDLARLPVAEVATRLGPAGAALVRAARGLDARPFAPHPVAGAVEEAITLEYPLEQLEPLLFVLRGLVERVLGRVGLDGVGCARIGLVLGLDDRSRDAREIVLAAPTRDPKALLLCLRVEVEARPPRAAIVMLALTAVPERVPVAQLGLFAPPGPAPERLATTLARLAALCGADRVGAPAVVDSHRPEVAALMPFRPPGHAPLPAAAPPSSCALVVRVLRPPQPLQVFCDRDRPDFVRGAGLGGRVIAVAGPWRLSTEWWSERACARDYYDLELSDGGVYRCYRDAASGQWFTDGVYD